MTVQMQKQAPITQLRCIIYSNIVWKGNNITILGDSCIGGIPKKEFDKYTKENAYILSFKEPKICTRYVHLCSAKCI